MDNDDWEEQHEQEHDNKEAVKYLKRFIKGFLPINRQIPYLFIHQLPHGANYNLEYNYNEKELRDFFMAMIMHDELFASMVLDMSIAARIKLQNNNWLMLDKI